MESGEFEITRKKKNQYKLKDPADAGSSKASDEEYLTKLIGPRKPGRTLLEKKKGHTSSSDYEVTKSLGNNSLYSGERGQRGFYRIMTVGKGNFFGFEDIYFGRHCTTSVKCISNEGKLILLRSIEFQQFINRDKHCLRIHQNRFPRI